MVPSVTNIYTPPPVQRQRVMPNITLTNYCNTFQGDWGHKLRGGKRKGGISITFQKMGGIGNILDQLSQHKKGHYQLSNINCRARRSKQ